MKIELVMTSYVDFYGERRYTFLIDNKKEIVIAADPGIEIEDVKEFIRILHNEN